MLLAVVMSPALLLTSMATVVPVEAACVNHTGDGNHSVSCTATASHSLSASQPAPTTTPAPPTTTTAAPTPAPTTMSPCEMGRFYCDDTMWRCVRGSSFNRCGCLAEYWDCLVNRACGASEADERTCADRSSGLLCPEIDEASGLRVCPKDAGTVFEDSSGWIVALVFFSLALLVLIVTVLYIAAVRGWIRGTHGRLLFGGRTPVESFAKRTAAKNAPKSKLARAYRSEQRARGRLAESSKTAGGGDEGEDGNPRLVVPTVGSAAGGVPDGAEPPEMVLVTPDGVERYKRYLRQKYDEARRRGEDVGDEPALIREDFVRGRDGKVRPVRTAFDRRAEMELAALQRDNEESQQQLAHKALEIDSVNRQVDEHRQRLAELLTIESQRLVREYSVGREAAREYLPSELQFNADDGTLVPRSDLVLQLSPPQPSDRDVPPSQPPEHEVAARFQLPGAGDGVPDRYGGFAPARMPPTNNSAAYMPTSSEHVYAPALPSRAQSGVPDYGQPEGGRSVQLDDLHVSANPIAASFGAADFGHHHAQGAGSSANPGGGAQAAPPGGAADLRQPGTHPLLRFARGASPVPSDEL